MKWCVCVGGVFAQKSFKATSKPEESLYLGLEAHNFYLGTNIFPASICSVSAIKDILESRFFF